MKKTIVTMCLMLCLLFGVTSGGFAVFAAVSLEECDLCFQQTVGSILDETEVNGNSIVTQRRLLYDLKLNELGYVYSFETVYGDGYAIIICDNGNYVAQEFVKSSASPYAQVTGEGELCVYANTMKYFKSVNGEICDINTSQPLTAAELEAVGELAVYYQGNATNDYEFVTVNIEYVAHSAERKAICWSAPEYANTGWTSGCAAVAGGNLIGYYDRFYEDLIPNHEAGIAYGDRFIYYFADQYVNNAISTLYADMNGSAAGISEADFKSGMKKYCARKGLSCDFNSLKSGSKLSYDLVKNCIKTGYPLVLFLNTYNVCVSNYEQDAYTQISYEVHSGNHVMVGFEYRHVTYTHADGSDTQIKFIGVTTGWSDPRTGYFNIDYCTNVVSAYKVDIH